MLHVQQEEADAKAAKAAADKKVGGSSSAGGAAAAATATTGPTATAVDTAGTDSAANPGDDVDMADASAADAAGPSSTVAQLRAKHAGQKTGVPIP